MERFTEEIDLAEQYRLMGKHPLISTHKRVQTSVEGLYVDILLPFNIVFSYIAKLPAQEQKRVLALKRGADIVKSRYGVLKKKVLLEGAGEENDGKKIKNLLEPKQSELLDLFGRFYTTQEVYKVAANDWKMPVNLTSIQRFREKHMTQILALQEEYKKDYSNVRLGVKRSRLDQLSLLYNDRLDIYNKTKSKEDYKLLLATLKEIRTEIEGEKALVDLKVEMTVQTDISNHIYQDLMKSICISDIVLARAAGKIGVDPRYFIHRLHTSYYSKFTGLAPQAGNMDKDSIDYPSSIIYNFDRIEAANTEIVKEEQELQQPVIVLKTPEQQSIGDKLRQMLEDRLTKSKIDLRETQVRVERIERNFENEDD